MRLMLLFLYLAGPVIIQGQVNRLSGTDTMRIVFYNTENLYDPFNDTLKMDDDFLPGEARAWGYKKFKVKTFQLARALIAAGTWQSPAIIGLCEVENLFVLKKLVLESPLKKNNYGILHFESPDPRGVDVAMLYDTSRFHLLYSRAISMSNPRDPSFLTRDVLYAKGLVFDTDTLHVFVNHWPSKYGGLASSLEKRKYVATRLRMVTDSLLAQDAHANILLMGDFNEDSHEEVMVTFINNKEEAAQSLVNLMSRLTVNSGSHKYKGEWSSLDQMIVSPSLLNGKTRISEEGAIIVRDSFLLEPDESYSGYKPFRTFSGPRYLGGFSDHLPVKVDLIHLK